MIVNVRIILGPKKKFKGKVRHTHKTRDLFILSL